MLYLRDFGALPDTSDDPTSAFNTAVAQAVAKGQGLQLEAGTYRFRTQPAPITGGVTIQGEGFSGNEGIGTELVADYDEPNPEAGFLSWTGTAPRGSGGGVRDLIITKGRGRMGGTAILLKAQDGRYRPGWWTLQNVFVHGYTLPAFHHALLIDGMNAPVPGSQGVRDVALSNFWAGQATISEQTVLVRNVVSLIWTGGQLFPAASEATAGVTITGGPNVVGSFQASSYVQITGVIVLGRVVFDHVKQFNFQGHASEGVQITPNASDGVVAGLILGKVDNKGQSVKVG